MTDATKAARPYPTGSIVAIEYSSTENRKPTRFDPTNGKPLDGGEVTVKTIHGARVTRNLPGGKYSKPKVETTAGTFETDERGFEVREIHSYRGTSKRLAGKSDDATVAAFLEAEKVEQARKAEIAAHTKVLTHLRTAFGTALIDTGYSSLNVDSENVVKVALKLSLDEARQVAALVTALRSIAAEQTAQVAS